jgi:hypothetical protein
VREEGRKLNEGEGRRKKFKGVTCCYRLLLLDEEDLIPFVTLFKHVPLKRHVSQWSWHSNGFIFLLPPSLSSLPSLPLPSLPFPVGHHMYVHPEEEPHGR